jgi:hypothetical protein
MKIKRFIRLLALILIIAMASVLPVPILFYNKDKLPKHLIEQIDKKESKIENREIKEIT